ncbi:MAG: hypothetical protein AWT59_2910 [Candidatus Gallionella acididurans]|uniref:Uncharacterized protein n=1 Tax=Candidatus Gallionella acididurans TaxID=1796491 RepID=A0A139BPT2_9PROT|nr:MAG: hypothetical protein AWT59_2910 [Candidatus Gallionella acididurans]
MLMLGMLMSFIIFWHCFSAYPFRPDGLCAYRRHKWAVVFKPIVEIAIMAIKISL